MFKKKRLRNQSNVMIFGTVTDNIEKTRLFPLEAFDESLAQGYIKLRMIDKILYVEVIDTYGKENHLEEINYIKQGYIKIGYKLKNI